MINIHWVVSNYPHLNDQQTGIFYRLLAEQLVQQGVSLDVIAPVPYTGKYLAHFSKKYRRFFETPSHEVQQGVRIWRPRYLTHPGEAHAGIAHYTMGRAIRRLNLGQPDLVHGFGTYPASQTAMLYAKRMNVPSVTTFIGSDVNIYPFQSSENRKRFLRTVSGSDQVLCVSHDLREKVIQLSGKDASVMYMPIVFYPDTAATKTDIRKKYGLAPHSFILLFAGNLYASKGVRELCTALEGIADQHDIFAVFAGPASPLIKKIQALENAQWIGQLPHEELLQLMAAVDVLVLPSHHEGIPGVIKEAGQCNTPVIATRVGGIPEVLSEDRGWMIDLGDIAGLQSVILEVKNNYSIAKQRAASLKSFIEQTFHPDKIVREQLKIYNRLIKN